MISRAARFEVLRILMKGMSSGTMIGTSILCIKPTIAFASAAPRPVLGLKPGSIALMCSRGFSRANANAAARMACLVVA